MKKFLLPATLGLLFFAACTHFEEPTNESTDQPNGYKVLTRSSGSSDQNPYSLANVQQAYNEVASELGLPPRTITPSHHYVRFAVRDTLDSYILSDSLGLELIEYPLDRRLSGAEIEEYMTDTLNYWRYTAVPADFAYPSEVEHEFLDYAYMQAEDDYPQTRGGDTPTFDTLPNPFTMDVMLKNLRVLE